MNLDLEKVPYEKMNTVKVDNETLKLLEELTGCSGCCYDWWELSQGVKNIAVGLTLLKKHRCI